MTKRNGLSLLGFVESAINHRCEIQQVDKIGWIAGERLTESAGFDIMFVDFYKFIPRGACSRDDGGTV